MLAPLITRPVKRFFAFGCSFTDYYWTTWPEIIAEDLQVPEFYNLGKIGAGNEYMLNKLMQIDQLYHLNEDDLVIICWSNVTREDRYIKGKWLTLGNIYNLTGTYRSEKIPKEIIDAFYSNPQDLLLHDFAFVKSARMLLEHRKVKWHFLQMLNTFDKLDQYDQIHSINNEFEELTDIEKTFIKPSFYDVLWNGKIYNKLLKMQEQGNFIDLHPSPQEHLDYLKLTFTHNWNSITEEKVKIIEEQFNQKMSHIKEHKDMAFGFEKLRLSDNIKTF